MTTSRVLACDADILINRDPIVTLYGKQMVGEHYTCPNRSRPASSEPVLHLVALRDGWTVTLDGRHLCPAHAPTEGAAA